MKVVKPLKPLTYIEKRDLLIPIAVQIANSKCGKYPPKAAERKKRDAWNDTWNFIYHSTMTKLAIENGLEKPPKISNINKFSKAA